MAQRPPDPNAPGPDGAPKRHPTEPYVGSGDATTQTPVFNEEATTTTTPAVGDDPLGGGRLDAGRSEPSQPGAVIGPITNRRKKTSPYQDATDPGERRAPSPREDKSKEPKQKKSWPRRILKWFLWTVAILILLVGAAIAFFHTGPGKSVARGIVESALGDSYDGVVTLGGLDYALGGDVELTDLKIAEKSGRTVVHLKHLLVDLDWGSLFSKPLTIEKLAIDGLDLDLVNFADGTSNLKRMQKKPTKLPEQIVIQSLEIKGVNAQIEQPNGEKVKASDIEVRAALALDNPAGTLDLKLEKLSGSFDTPKLNAVFDLAASASKKGEAIEATLDPKVLKVVPKSLGDQAIDVVIKPIKVSLKDGTAEMNFGGLEAGPLKIAGMRTVGHLPPPGTVGLGPGEHLLELTGVHLDKAGVNKLLGREVLLSDVGIDASVKGPKEKLVVDGKVTTDGGRLGLTGWVDAHDLTNPVLHLELIGTDLDTTKILAGEKRPDMQTSFKGVIDLKGLPPNHELTFHADIGKTTVGGRSIDSVVIDASSKGTLLQLDGLVVTAFGQELTVDGQFDQGTREFRAGMRTTTVLGDAIQKARDAGVLVAPLPPISGLLDVDLGVSGKLKPIPVPVPGVAVAPATPFDPKALIVNGRIDLSSLPIETAQLKGHINAKDVVVKGPPDSGLPDKKVGEVDVTIDLNVEGGKPDGVKGLIVAKITKLDTGKTTLDAGEVTVALDGLTQDITVKASDERQALALDLAMKSVLDLDKRHVDTTITRLEVKRGPAHTKLEAPVTIGIDSAPDGKQAIRIPPMKLALAGGTLDVAVAADLSKDEANPGANKIDHFDLSLDLDGVDVARLAALAGRSTRGLAGRLDASVRAQGTKENPQLDFFGTLRGRMKNADPFTAKFDGALRDKKLDLGLNLLDRDKAPILKLDVMAPLNLPTTPGAKPSLGSGRFEIKADMPETTLARLGALMPNGLPPNLDPEATLGLGLELSGTTTRPTGDWHLTWVGDLLRRRGFEKAPARQKLAIAGTLRPEGAQTLLDNDLDLHLDADGAPFIAHHTAASFSRSPLLKGFMDKPWTLEAGLEKPLDLKVLSDLGLAKKPLAGTFTTNAKLHGAGADVLGTLELLLADVRYGTAPKADIEGLVTIGERDIQVSQKIKAAGLDALAIDAVIGVPGKGLRTFVKDRPRLMRAPLSGEVRLVEHAIAEWRKALEGVAKVPDLPGNVGGALTLGGDLQTPTAKGAFAWDGFETAAATPGRIAFELDAGAERAEGGLALGNAREVTVRGGVARKDLKPPPLGVTPPPLPIDLAMKADKVDLLTIVPGFVTAGKPWKVKGTLDWSMTGQLMSSRDPAAPGLAPGSYLLGDFLVSALDIEVPDTDRHIRDGRIALKATREALEIPGIELREGRFPTLADFIAPPADTRGDRTVQVTGKVPWTDLKVSEASLEVKTYDWLVLGQGFDGPEGELDLDLAVVAKDLTSPVKTIDVTIAGLDLYSPDRFIRAHYPQFPAYDDVVYLDVSGKPSGVLPPGKGTPPAPPDPNAPAPDPAAGFDVHLKIPQPAHIVFAGTSPLELKLQGAMDVAMRGKDLNLKGRIDVIDGELDAMGRPFKLQHGAITADGGLETAAADMLFAIMPSPIALRDIAAGGRGDLATITLHASAKTGLVSTFSGVSGPYLLDMLTLLNTGRARLWGMPDVPASETVRFGNPDHGLVLTFIQTNLRNLIFMDRANGWSESQEEPAEYGRLRFFDMQRFVGGSRVRLSAQPVTIGQNRMELGYDWLLVDDPNAVLGFGPHLGIDLRAGLGFSLDWSSKN